MNMKNQYKTSETMYIRDRLQEGLDEIGEDYLLKTNDELIDQISEFGFGEMEFHTIDIERLILENIELNKSVVQWQIQYNKAATQIEELTGEEQLKVLIKE